MVFKGGTKTSSHVRKDGTGVVQHGVEKALEKSHECVDI